MAKQEAISFMRFKDYFIDEESCREHLFQLRWPNGYYCPKCGERSSQVKRVHIASLNCPVCHRPLDMKPEKVWYASDEEDDSILLEE